MSVVFPFMEKEKREFVVKKRENFFTTFFESTYYIPCRPAQRAELRWELSSQPLREPQAILILMLLAQFGGILKTKQKPPKTSTQTFWLLRIHTYTHKKKTEFLCSFSFPLLKQHSLNKLAKLFSCVKVTKIRLKVLF